MSWLITAAAVAYAIVIRGGLSVSRGRVAKWKDRFERADYDRNFLTEECMKFISRATKAEDEVTRLQGRLRAYEIADWARARWRAN
jgi:hypothetical protein